MWIGTSGWTYDGWRGPFYRSGSRWRYSGPAEEARPAQVVYAGSVGIPGKQHWAAAAVTPASDQKLVKCLLAAQSLQTDWLR